MFTIWSKDSSLKEDATANESNDSGKVRSILVTFLASLSTGCLLESSSSIDKIVDTCLSRSSASLNEIYSIFAWRFSIAWLENIF